jgi:hypothetical protein
MKVAPMSFAMFSIHTAPLVVRPPALGLVPVSTGGFSGPPSDLPPAVYESYYLHDCTSDQVER